MPVAMRQPPAGDQRGDTLKLHRGATSGEVSIAAIQPKLLGNASFFKGGMPLAIDYLKSGMAAQLPYRTRKGGARNRADRESHELSVSHVGNLLAATLHANAIGLPFNRMITVHWEAAGVPLAGIAKATGHFTDLLGKALARHGSGTTWLWTHEGGADKGGHCHLLIHVPEALVPMLSGLQRGWLRRITRQPYRKRVIKSKPIGRL